MCITGEVLKEIPNEEEITGTTEKSGLENRLITSFWSVYGLLCCCCFLNQHLNKLWKHNLEQEHFVYTQPLCSSSVYW